MGMVKKGKLFGVIPMKAEKQKKMWTWIAVCLCIFFPIGIFVCGCICCYYCCCRKKSTSGDSSSDSDEGKQIYQHHAPPPAREYHGGGERCIGSVRVENGNYVFDGCFTGVQQVGSHDVAYNHPRITRGGSYANFSYSIHQNASLYKLKTSYFAGWDQPDHTCFVTVNMNGLNYCDRKMVKGEHLGRQVDEFFVLPDNIGRDGAL